MPLSSLKNFKTMQGGFVKLAILSLASNLVQLCFKGRTHNVLGPSSTNSPCDGHALGIWQGNMMLMRTWGAACNACALFLTNFVGSDVIDA